MNYNLNELSIGELRALQIELSNTLSKKITAQKEQDVKDIREFINNKLKNNPDLESEIAIEFGENDVYIGLTWGNIFDLS